MNKFWKKIGLIIATITLGLILPTSCNSKNEFIDYTHNGSISLTLDYKGHDFYNDGIAQVDLKSAIDGDTAHFNEKNKESETIKSRFYGIDTPESTGKVQEYGKAASNFTKEKLNKAAKDGTIVVSSPSFAYEKPQTDSTGTRYLSLVWINEEVENCDYKDLVLLNLYIVQEGFSYVKAVDKIPEYSNTFYLAEQQAKNSLLNLFSGKSDPLFNYGDYVDVSLLDLKQELLKSIKDPSHVNIYDNANVRVRGVVAGFIDHMMYLQAFFDEESGSTVKGGEWASINVFTGMSSIRSKYTKVNTYLQLCGTASVSENFGFQISGVKSWPAVDSTNEADTQVLYTPQNIPDEYKVHEYQLAPGEIKGGDYEYLYSPVTISENVVVRDAYVSDGGEISLYLNDENGNKLSFGAFIQFTYKPYQEDHPNLIWNKKEDYIGKTFSLKGIYSYHTYDSGTTSYQIIPRNGSDLVVIEDSAL